MQPSSPCVLSTARPLTTSRAQSPRCWVSRCCCPPSPWAAPPPFLMKGEEVQGHLTLALIGCRLSPLQSRRLLADPGHPLPSSSRFPISPWLGTVAGEASCLLVGLYLASSVPKVWSNLSCFGIIPSSREGGAGRAVCPSPGTRVPTSSGLSLLLCIFACVLSQFSRVRLFATPWTVACQAPLSMGLSRQEYRSGLPCPPPGHLPDPGMESTFPMSSASAGGFFTPSAT